MHHTHFLQNNSVLLELSLTQIEYIVRHHRCSQFHDTIHYKVSKPEHIQLLYDKLAVTSNHDLIIVVSGHTFSLIVYIVLTRLSFLRFVVVVLAQW